MIARQLGIQGLIGAVSTALFLSLTTVTHAAGTQVVHHRLPAAVRSLPPIERYPGTNQLNLAIGLPLRNPEVLTNLLRQIYDPASPNYRHYLTPKQFTERFGPTEKDYQTVIDFAKAHGLRVTATHPNRILVDVSASVTDLEKALHVKFQVFQHPTEKRLFHAPDTEPSLDLAVPVLGISGLDNYSLPRPHLWATPLTNGPSASPNTGSGPSGTFLGGDFRAAYAPDTTLNGSGQVVGLLQFDGYTASDISYYESRAGLPSVTLSNVLVDGASGKPTGNELEVSLDIEMAISMATNLSEVVVYMTPNPSPWEDILSRMANDNVAKQLSCSWYEIDGVSNAVADQIFQQMAVQGQSFFAASGDDDAFTGLIPFPCDSPYITVVGGTTLTTSGPGGSWVSETAWNRGSGVGSGGGISTQYPIPSWQTNINMTSNRGSTTRRNIPDVAMVAESVYVRVDGADDIVGGTSCAAPLWAGFAALANQQATARAESPIGFVAPAAAAIGTGTYYPAVFHDITTGNNLSRNSPDQFYAVTGYDLCTGWGTPRGQMMIESLADPESLALVVTPASGFNFIGPAGGPFATVSQSFSLTNNGAIPLNWMLVNTSIWLNASTGGGAMTATMPSTTVTMSLNSTASNLPVGNYGATVWFTNLNSGVGQSRQFNLSIGEIPVVTAAPTNQTAVVGGTATFGVAISSIGSCTCQWQLNGTNLPDGIITTLAGEGSAGFSGDGGQATNASLDNPYGVTLDSAGNLFVADTDNARIRQVDSYGTITTVAGDGIPGDSGDGGPAANASLDNPIGVAVDEAGDLFIADADNNRIRERGSDGTITTVAGDGSAGFAGDGGAATNAAFSYPYGVAMDGAGNLFIADLGNNRIRKVDTNGIITTVAGNGNAGYSGDGGAATNAAFSYPYGVAVDGAGNLFIADLGNNRIRKVDTNGIITTVAGNGNAGYSGDGGPAANATFSAPAGIAVDGAGNLFIADSGNNRIREVETNGMATTVAGDGSAGYSGDGGPAINAALSYPIGVAVDGAGNLFVADSGNNGIRKILSSAYPTLTLYNVTANDAGSYAVIISNAWGSVTSSVAVLTVLAPPVITQQPTNQTVVGGGTASFNVTASGTAPLAYQWLKNGLELTDGGDLSGSAATNLIMTAVSTNDAGNYTVIITNVWGSVTSSVAALAVVFPPVITSQPQSLTVSNGTPAGFGVTVSGSAPLGCQWQKNGVNLTDGGELSGSATTSLAFNPATITDTGTYTIIITNAWGSITSSVATLTVLSPPVIVLQPTNETIVGGSTASFSVTVWGTAPLGYQWQENGLDLTDGGELSGSATTNLLLSAAAMNDAGSYTIIITNAWGSVTSSIATLTVVFPPVITSQPQGQTVTNGNPASFSVAASGTAPLGYQWQKNGINLADAGQLSSSATTSLELGAATINEAGNYTIIITNAWGSVTSSIASLTVLAPPVITQQPTNLIVVVGGTADFSVTASGTAPLGYQWQNNGLDLTDGGELSGSATTNLVLDAASTNDVGNYTVIVTNAWGSVTSSVASLTVVFPPVITQQPTNQMVLVGAATSFSVAVSGTAPLGYQWQYNGLVLTDGGELSGSATTNLVLSATAMNEAGNYTIIITNAWGSVTSSIASLTVLAPPVITQQPTNLIVVVGGTANFSVTASGTAPLGYQWLNNGLDLTDGGELSGSATTNLVLSTAGTNDVGNYTVIVTNAWGSVTSSVASLTVVFPPVITQQPTNQMVLVGAATSFSVAVSGTAPLGYQWQYNGLVLTDGGELSGSATTNLVLSATAMNEAGNYAIIITNAWGSVTSSIATLTVLAPPAITQQPTNLIVVVGGTADFSVTASGTAPLGYQWLNNGLDLTDGGELSGSATTNLVLSTAGTNDVGNYTVIVTNAWGSVTSSVASLTVVFPPVITQQPTNQMVLVGAATSFSVAVSGTAPLGYQWQYNGLVLTDGGELSGSATTNLVLSATAMNEAGNYTIIITNAWGSVTSSIASLTVLAPPVITQQPTNLIVVVGGTANFSVTASGTAPLGYQWLNNGLDLTDGGELSGSATTNLVLSTAGTNDVGNYTVIVTNAWGSVTSSVASLTVVFPPVITQQPTNQMVLVGAATSFSVAVSGTAPLGYQWQYNGLVLTDGGELSGSATTNLVLSATAMNEAGNYAIIITNAWGSVTSSIATLTVLAPPAITQQPTNLIVVVGGTADFSVTASGTAPLGYQWQNNGLDLTDGGELSGSATTNLVLSTAGTNDVGNYTVIVTNAWGSVTSSVASLTVVFPPVITQQPTNQMVLVGTATSFSVAVSGTAPLGYQWQYNGLVLTDGGELSGSATTNLVLSATAMNEAGNYAIIVTNAWGSVTSSIATLTVLAPPAITQQPANQIAVVGGTVSFSISASGTAPLGYQWQDNGMNVTDGGELSGSATTNLVLSTVSTNDAGNYTVIVTNAWGSVTSSVANLTVVFPPAITEQPTNEVVLIGGPTGFSVGVSGTPPLSYQWRNNGMDLTEGGTLSGSATANLMLSATANLMLGTATMNDAGNYTVIITNAWGSVTSSVATLTVVSPPVIVQGPTNEIVVVGGAASFSITASGTAPLGYQWQKNGLDLTEGGEISGSATTNLVLDAASTNDVGTYSVIVTNVWGSITSSVASLTVAFPPAITEQPTNQVVMAGEPASFSVAVSGTALLGYQWQCNGLALTDGGELSGSATTNLVLSAATINEAGNYTIIITNAWGSVTSSMATLTVVSPPVIAQQPTNQIVMVGGVASFSVSALGTAPLGYQWQNNGLALTDGGELSGSATTNLVLDATSTNDVGNYTVIVTNAWGSVTSSVASLTVAFPPVITSQPQSLTVTNSDPASFSVAVSGTASLSCQWQENGTNLTDGSTVSGSATTNLVLSTTTMNDMGNYIVIVTNAWGSITSSVATLTVISPLVITQQPTNQIVVVGSTASFSIAASGTPPVSYQWSFNGTNLSGATNTSLVLSNVQPGQAGTYAVLVTNRFGSILSSNAVLTVTPDHFSWGQISSPRFLNTPFSVTIQARDMTNGIFTNFASTAYLDSSNGLAVSPALSGKFVQGSWTGTVVISQVITNLVLRASDGFGHSGLANAISVVALPQLTARISGHTLQFLWPVSDSGFVLEASGGVSPAAWTVISASPIRLGNQFLVPVQMPGTNTFYRLQNTNP